MMIAQEVVYTPFFIVYLRRCEDYYVTFLGRFFCRCYSVISVEHKDNPKLYFPSVVVGASDVIRICKDLGNNILDKYDNSIEYHVMDLNDRNTTERFLFRLNEAESKNMSFQGLNQFTGIEWWNKDGNYPFPI